MNVKENPTSFKLWPPFWPEGILLGLYCVFWVLVGLRSGEWEWLRGDSQALNTYTLWGLIILGFCSYRLKKWITKIQFSTTRLKYRRFFSIQTHHREVSELILVRRRKKGRILLKVYSKYCDFLGQFYLDEDKCKLLLNTLDKNSLELVEDRAK